MNEQYVTLVGKVCSPRYEEVYTPEVKSKLPIEASSEGRNLKDYIIYGNNNPNHVDESQSTLPVSIDTYGGNAVDWEIYGNNNPVVENKTGTLPINASATAGNLLDWTINGNNNSGKNVVQLGESQTVNGVTLTIDSQAGTVIMNGDTTSAEAGFSVNLFDTSSLVGGDYIFSGGADGGSSTTYDLYLYNRTDQVYVGRLYNSSDIISATIESGKRYTVYIQCRKGQVYDNIVFKPMLRPANTTSTFEPYTVGVGERTGNLADVESATVNSRITVNTLQNSTGTIWETTSGGANYIEFALYPLFEEGKTYTISFNNLYTENTMSRVTIRRKKTFTIRYSSRLTTYGENSFSFTYTAEDFPDGAYVSILLNNNTGAAGELHIENLMLVEGNTAPESFIPYGYQIPMQAKQRTKNLYNITNAYCLNAGVTVQEENGRLHIFGNSTNNANHIIGILVGSLLTQISLEAGQYVLSGAVANTNSNYRIQLLYINPDGSAGAIIGYDSGDGLEFTLEEPSTVYMRIYVKAAAYQQDVDLLFSPMIRRADTSSDFEPYYNINQTDIYIGNSPLTQGQSITKAQSGRDVTLFSGDNIIDTSLYNKPNVNITYNSSILGVGEPTQNEFEITGNDTYTYRGVTFVRDKINNTIVANGQATGNVFYECGDITLKAGVKYILTGCPAGGGYSPNTYLIYAMGHSDWGYDTGNGLVLPIMTEDTVITPRIGVYTGAGAFTDLVFKPEVKKVGYQIPISVTSGQQSALYNIYVGENLLTEGQSVSKSSFNTDIALYQGNNTISTSLGNKPEMKIDYLSTEVGVGERTKNFVRATNGVTTSGVTFTVDSVAGTVTANGTATGVAQLRIAINAPEELNNTTVPPGNYYFSGTPSGGSGASYNCYSWDIDTGARSKQWDGTTNSETDLGQGNCQVQINGHRQSIFLRIAKSYTANNVVFKPMLRRADTTSEFEPYGYKVPVKVYDDEDNSETYDVYIGSQPLVSGASVNKDGAGVNIELNEGVNTIKTDLYNEPEMYIK